MIRKRTAHLRDLLLVQFLAHPGIALDLLRVELPLGKKANLYFSQLPPAAHTLSLVPKPNPNINGHLSNRGSPKKKQGKKRKERKLEGVKA